jgi:hypothetical protein
LPKADSQFEEANSGRMAFLRQGKRSFSGELWSEDSTPTFLGKLTKSRCVDFGIYIVDVNGNLIGSEVDGYLYPIPVDNPSWDPRFMFATDSTVQKIMLGFDFDRLFDESTMYMITPDEAGQNFNELEGLIDVLFTNTSAAGTFDSVTFDAKLHYGTALNKILYTGATNVADWELYINGVLTPLSGSPVESPDGTYINGVLTPLSGSPVESPDGTYTLSFAAQSSGDVALVKVARTGYIGEVSITL